jgi:hypothetical protein
MTNQTPSEYDSISVLRETKEELYDRKQMGETWDETIRRLAFRQE